MRTWVGIPYQDRADLTRPLVRMLLADPTIDRLILWDNGSTDDDTIRWAIELAAAGPRVQLRRCPKVGGDYDGRPWSLYDCWNGTLAEARKSGVPANVVLLNNDVTVLDGFVRTLTDALRSTPDDVWIVYPNERRALSTGVDDLGITRTRGLWPAGLTGFAFAIKSECPLPPIDPRLVFYCGDTAWLWEVERAGATCARVEGLPLHHRLGATRKQGRWAAQIEADRATLAVLYPHGPR